jgi:hypothetical protein
MTQSTGPFELREPLPEMKDPHLLVALRPWIDVGSVATMALTFLEEAWGSQEVAHLSRPGRFYDFTRYRPVLHRSEGQRRVSVPNTTLNFAGAPDGREFLLLQALEPHVNGEEFVEGLMDLIRRLGVREYGLIGSMYAPVPHTRPPLVTGGASNPELNRRLHQIGARESTYEGPTTILAILPSMAIEAGIDTFTMILQLPVYAQLENDYRGLQAMLIYLSALYHLDLDLAPVRQQVGEQMFALDETVRDNPELSRWVEELERAYDAEHLSPAAASEEEAPALSPELESFLRDIERRWGDGETK